MKCMSTHTIVEKGELDLSRDRILEDIQRRA